MSGIGRRAILGGGGAAVLARAPWAQTGLRELTATISSTSFASALARVAQAMGLFAAQGLSLRFVTMDSANAATAALISGSAQLAVSGPGELVAAQARGQPVVLIADTYRGFGASLVLSRAAASGTGVAPDAPAAARLKALDGMLIASPSATSSYTAAYRGAAEASGARIRFTYMAQGAMAAAVENGAIQGFIGGAPFWGFPVARGAALLWLSGPKGDLPAANVPVSTSDIQAMRPFADANPAVIRGIVEGVRAFGAAVRTQPDAVEAGVLKLYPDVDPATMSLLFATEAKAWVTQPLTPEDMRHEIDFMRSSGTAIPGMDRIDPAALVYQVPA